MPLENDLVFSYRTYSEETGEQGLLTLRVRPRAGTLFELTTGGRSQLLDVKPNAVEHASGGFLLKAPLSEGASFPGEFGRVTIEAVGIPAKVPAGDYTGCIRTVEELARGGQTQRSTKVFCPGVGMVSMSTEISGGGGFRAERAKLTWTGKSVDIMSE